MDRDSIRQGHHSQYPAFKFAYFCPKPHPRISLDLNPERVFNYKYTPFFSQKGAFAKDFVLEIGGELVIGHVDCLPRKWK